jgi:hypothetical protein
LGLPSHILGMSVYDYQELITKDHWVDFTDCKSLSGGRERHVLNVEKFWSKAKSKKYKSFQSCKHSQVFYSKGFNLSFNLFLLFLRKCVDRRHLLQNTWKHNKRNKGITNIKGNKQQFLKVFCFDVLQNHFSLKTKGSNDF